MRAIARKVSFGAASLIHKFSTPLFITGAALTVFACVDEPAAPSRGALANIVQTESGALLLSTGGSVWRSATASDSSGDLLVARTTVLGARGDTLAVRLVAEEESYPPSRGNDRAMIAIVGGKYMAISHAALRKGHRIYTFDHDGSIQVEYRLERRRGAATQSEGSRLLQTTSGQIISAETPWVFEDRGVAGVAAARGGGQGGTTCPLNAATGTCDSVQWNIVPYASGVAFPGFQSDAGSTGPSHEISLTFSSNLSSITVKVNDPTWVGNKMIAYNGSDVLDTAAFVGSGIPGFNSPSMRTISGAVTRVLLVPAPNDYVTYEVSIVVDGNVRLNVSCSPAPVMRAAVVTCTASLSNNKAFTVLYGSVDAPDNSPAFVPFTSTNGGKAWQAQGPGLYPTTLSVVAFSGTTSYSGTGYVTISPRTFPSISFPALPTERKATPNDGFVFFEMAVGVIPMRWAEISPPRLDTVALGSIPVVTATSGPSIGYATVGPIASLPLVRPEVVLNPTLYREGFFYKDQNGHDGLSDRNESGVLYCNNATDSSWVDRVLTFVRRHEGMTGATNSHYGLWTQAFQTLNPQGAIESLVFPNNTPQDQVKGRVVKSLTDWLSLSAVDNPHVDLNNADGTAARFDAEAGCALDRDLKREKGL